MSLRFFLASSVPSRGFTVSTIVFLGAAVVFLGAGCARPAATSLRDEPAVYSEPTTSSVIQPHHVMTGIVLPHYPKLVGELTRAPQSDADWQSLETHAALLNESSVILMRAVGGGDDAWVHAATTLRDSSRRALSAISDHDLARTRHAVEELNQSCSSCHRECEAVYQLPWQQQAAPE